MHMQEIIAAHPDVQGMTNGALVRAVELAYECSQVCLACADACLAEQDQALVQCIRLTLDCTDICYTTGVIATRRAGSNEAIVARMLEVCEQMCRACAEECERHAHMEHCRLCAETCRACEAACRDARPTVTPEQLQ